MAKKHIAKKSGASKPKSAAKPTFEASLASLESAVAELESGELGLDEALERYEAGVGALKRCHEQLAAAERRIEVLSGVDAEGNPITEPLEGAETATADSGDGTRAKRRSRQAAKSDDVDDSRGLF